FLNDTRPIKAAIQEKKQTFEEFLEEQIQLEEQRLKQKQKLQETNGSAIQKAVIKKPFLRRGEGLARFTNAKSKMTKHGDKTPKLEQRASDDRNVLKGARPQIQKRTVLPGKKYNHSQKAKHCPVQKNLVLRSESGKKSCPLGKSPDGQMRVSVPSEMNNNIENKENSGTEKPQLPPELENSASGQPQSARGPHGSESELSFEVSFQSKLDSWEKEKERENLELDEFLFLEQAADEMSFSSNSSFVQRILDQDQQIFKGRRMSSTPIKAKEQQGKALAVELLNKKTQK
ncbi:CENPJ protein, partial [Bucco capensis]|nr:CENPJ protein [Bucco capensis]